MASKPETYVVKKGNTLSKIAKQYNFSDWEDIWKHKLNRELVSLRKKPEKIEPGDKIVIPPNEKAEEEVAHIESVLKKLQKVREESEKSFDDLEEELDKQYEDLTSFGEKIDFVAMVGTAFVGAYGAASRLAQEAEKIAAKKVLSTAVKEVGKDIVKDKLLDITKPSNLADLFTKATTGEDSKTAHKKAVKQLLNAKFKALEQVDFKIRDYEKLLNEAKKSTKR